MTTAWTFEGETAHLGGPVDTITLVEETTFCRSDRCGDVLIGGPHGLLFLDTRFVSAFELKVAGTSPEALGCSIDDPYRATFVSRVQRAGSVDEQLLVARERRVGRGMV